MKSDEWFMFIVGLSAGIYFCILTNLIVNAL